MKMEEFDRKLENLADYVSKVEQIDLWPVQGTDRKKLYGNIKKLFDKELKSELVHIDEIGRVNDFDSRDNYRLSFYTFNFGPSIEVSDMNRIPAISLRYDNREGLIYKTYLLANLIKENLGVELSIKEQ